MQYKVESLFENFYTHLHSGRFNEEFELGSLTNFMKDVRILNGEKVKQLSSFVLMHKLVGGYTGLFLSLYDKLKTQSFMIDLKLSCVGMGELLFNVPKNISLEQVKEYIEPFLNVSVTAQDPYTSELRAVPIQLTTEYYTFQNNLKY